MIRSHFRIIATNVRTIVGPNSIPARLSM